MHIIHAIYNGSTSTKYVECTEFREANRVIPLFCVLLSKQYHCCNFKVLNMQHGNTHYNLVTSAYFDML